MQFHKLFHYCPHPEQNHRCTIFGLGIPPFLDIQSLTSQIFSKWDRTSKVPYCKNTVSPYFNVYKVSIPQLIGLGSSHGSRYHSCFCGPQVVEGFPLAPGCSDPATACHPSLEGAPTAAPAVFIHIPNEITRTRRWNVDPAHGWVIGVGTAWYGPYLLELFSQQNSTRNHQKPANACKCKPLIELVSFAKDEEILPAWQPLT